MKLAMLIGAVIVSGCTTIDRTVNAAKIDPNMMAVKFYTYHNEYYCGSSSGYRNIDLYYEVDDIPQDAIHLAEGKVAANIWIGKAIENKPVTFYQISGEANGRNGNKCSWHSIAFSDKAPNNCHFTKIVHNGKKDTSEVLCFEP